MKTKIIVTLAFVLLGASQVWSDEIWDSGYHEIHEGDSYFEIYMRIDASATMFGGEVYKMETFDTTVFDMLGGDMGILYGHGDGDSIINIHGGTLDKLGASENCLVYLYAYDVIHHPTGGSRDYGWIEGMYYSNNTPFSFSFYNDTSYSHIRIVPEPTAFFLFGAGALFLSRKKGILTKVQ